MGSENCALRQVAVLYFQSSLLLLESPVCLGLLFSPQDELQMAL